jgi:predicted transglutaminase-like cysteine proteinase
MTRTRLLVQAGALGLGLSAVLASRADAALPCLEMADGCRVALDPTRERELAVVQQAVNAAIRPAGDMEVFSLVEYWTPLEGRARGDCDDYALTKLHWLTRLGWPRDALRLTLATLPNGEDHLVLAVRTDRGDYILDNLRSAPMAWTALPYSWLGQEVPGSGAWRAIVSEPPPANPAPATSAFPSWRQRVGP